MAQPTDRELLERAAVAYWGSEIDDVCSIRWLEEEQAIGYTHADNQDHNGVDREFVWNPLKSKDDAFSLMVKTKLHIGLESVTVSAWASDCYGNFQTEILSHRGDEAATCRAIVRAAAAKVKGGAL